MEAMWRHVMLSVCLCKATITSNNNKNTILAIHHLTLQKLQFGLKRWRGRENRDCYRNHTPPFPPPTPSNSACTLFCYLWGGGAAGLEGRGRVPSQLELCRGDVNKCRSLPEERAPRGKVRCYNPDSQKRLTRTGLDTAQDSAGPRAAPAQSSLGGERQQIHTAGKMCQDCVKGVKEGRKKEKVLTKEK